MRLLLDSNFYSVLYYNAVLWLTPELSLTIKQALLSILANALRSCMMSNCSEKSFVRIYPMCRKCTPSQIMSYQSSLLLHKIVNDIFESCTTEHATLLNNVVYSRRQLKFEIIRSKIGMNTFWNKFCHISKLISLDSLNLGFINFNKLMKLQFF